MSEKRFEVSIPMPHEGVTFVVDVAATDLIVLTVETLSCSLNLSFMFEPGSVDEVRRLSHALLAAADILAPPSKN